MQIEKVLEYPQVPEPNRLYLKQTGPQSVELGVSNSAGTVIHTTNGTDGVQPLSQLLIYYGCPISYKGMLNTAAVIAEISNNYSHWVVGDTYNNPSHEEYASTQTIIAGVRANGVKVYGYVPCAISGLTVPQIHASIDDWNDLDVDGVFLDEFGFDYGLSRQRQIDIVNYVHSLDLPYCANAWTVSDVTVDDIANHPFPSNDWRYIAYANANPSNLTLPRNPNDAYLFENFCFDHLGIKNIRDAQERMLHVKSQVTAANIQAWALAVFGETTPGVLDTTKLGSFRDLGEAVTYITVSAHLFDYSVVGLGGYSFGSNGTPITALLKTMPYSAEAPSEPASINYTTGIAKRFFGPVTLETQNLVDDQHVVVSIAETLEAKKTPSVSDVVFSTTRSNKDTEGIFTTINRHREDGTLYTVSVLSGGSTPLYTTRTETYYKPDGVTVDRVYVYTLTYDGAGDLAAETLS